ncbi:ABC transporter permease [Acuticoccus sp. MNP-M23]|uniref:ABC transporter permease n=1 Tax=Acuticoccus sp. MNP-M23 TaxID=3072793 RepID=UPI00281688D5|nr:ABC transporter permease [Acuticoccus sp. MNP-M23]WMS43630.1 ABC transporter permease [Acuticoccus sp. MNP-M23]
MTATDNAPERKPAARPRTTLRAFAVRYGLVALLVAMVAFFGFMEPAFLSVRNMVIVLQSVSIVAILALGVTATLVVGGFDLSIGAVAATALMTSSYVMVVFDAGTVPAVAACLALGALVGFCNGMLIVRFRVPDLLATLGMMFLLLGLQLIPTAGRSIATGMMLPDGSTANGSFTAAFLALGRYRVADLVPISVLVMLGLAVIITVFMTFTRYGRIMYAIGSNAQAARLAGAPVERYKIAAYMISGVFASIGGILLAARVGRGDVSSGNSLLLDAVAAALIGFAVFGAGKPNAIGTAIGALFVGLLLNGLTMMNAPYYAQDFVKGAVLVGALMFTFGLSVRRS